MSARLALNPRELAARNRIAGCVRDLAVPTDPPLRLSLRPLGAEEAASRDGLGEVETLAVEWGGARFGLSMPAAAFTDWLNARLAALGYEEATVAALSGPWAATARALALDWLFAALGRSGRGTARLVDATDWAAGDLPHVLVFELRVGPDGADRQEVLRGRLACDGLGLMLISGMLGDPPAVPGPLAGAVSGLPFALHVRLGHTTLPLARLRTLRARDVVLIAQPLNTEAGLFHLVLETPAGCWGLRARLADGALIPVDTLHPVMNDSNDPAPADQAGIAFDQLPVRLSFDLGSATVTLAELQNLQPGQGIPLDRPLGSAVAIRANGVCVGHGELVDIDGRAGVSVVSLFPPAATPSAPADEEDA